MRITKKTRTKDIEPLLNDERIRELTESVPPVPLKRPLLKMTCGEFIEALDEAYVLCFFREKRALTAFGRCREYLSQLEQITAYIRRFEIEQTADEKAAAKGVSFPTLGERILVECVKHYHLHSTAEAERLPLTDWLLVVKAEGSAAKYQHRLSQIQSRKAKNGKCRL